VGAANDFASVVAPVIREVSLILDDTLYAAVHDPPLKQGEKFSGLRRNVGIRARVDGDNLIAKWPDRKEAKARITCRERSIPIGPNPVSKVPAYYPF